MRQISVKEARDISFRILGEAEKRREEFFENEAKVVVMEEDIEEELLRQCRQHVQWLCDDLIIRPIEHSFNAWAEAGEQVYATWRGWV